MDIRVSWRYSLNLTGTIVKWLAAPLCFPLLLAVYYSEPLAPFLVTIGVALTVGWLLEQLDGEERCKDAKCTARERERAEFEQNTGVETRSQKDDAEAQCIAREEANEAPLAKADGSCPGRRRETHTQ